MSTLCWNCKGLRRPSAVRSLREVVRTHKPQILGLIETKVCVNKWETMRHNLGFLNYFAVDRLGLGGGLAVLWKEGVTVVVRSYSRFYVDMIVEEGIPYRLLLFYGRPEGNQRRESWELLHQLATDWEGPWVVMGDFNEVLYEWEVDSRGLRNRTRMRAFREVVEKCGLIDIGAKGARFTFSNKRLHPWEFKARLDRFFVNRAWLEEFPTFEGINGVVGTSDHCPIILRPRQGNIGSVSKRFRYEMMWQRHKAFPSLIQQVWQEVKDQGEAMEVMAMCSGHLERWNKEVFGNVQVKIQKIKRRIEALSKRTRTREVAEEEKRLERELDEWLEREETLWRQRSRFDWQKGGDRNTPFFHARASQRRKKNFIESLELRNGERVSRSEEIVEEVMAHYTNVFKSEL